MLWVVYVWASAPLTARRWYHRWSARASASRFQERLLETERDLGASHMHIGSASAHHVLPQVDNGLRATLTEVEEQEIETPILDPRNNPRGLRSQVVEVTGRFCESGNVLRNEHAEGEILLCKNSGWLMGRSSFSRWEGGVRWQGARSGARGSVPTTEVALPVGAALLIPLRTRDDSPAIVEPWRCAAVTRLELPANRVVSPSTL